MRTAAMVSGVLVVLLVGCGGSSGPGGGVGGNGAGGGTGGSIAGAGGSTAPAIADWADSITTPAWTCFGTMTTVFTPAASGAAVSGSWTCAETPAGCTYKQLYVSNTPCVAYSGAVTGTLSTARAIDIHLATDATHSIRMVGTLGNGDIAGSAMFSDGTFPFNAVFQ